MMGRGGGGRDRPSINYGPPRFVEKEQHQQHRKSSGWGVAPPSRHLWVGNLSSHVTESMLSEKFLRFGDLEKIGYIPGRSYAFVDYKKVEDAVIAMRALQGSNLSGMPIRIEFAKGDRGPPMDDDYPQYNDEMPFIERGRDSRIHHLSPEKPFDKSRGNSKTGEPSEVLWIGFPPSLNIDELVLRRAFSPFGEIVKITTFPGRSYAFIQYRTIVAACRAKEALHGKLFNNPRVHICFAKSEFAANEIGRSSFDVPHPPLFNPSFEPDQNLETFHRGRNFEGPGEFRISSPLMGYGGDNPLRPGPGPGPDLGGNFEHFRLQELNSGRKMSEELYERHRSSPSIERGATWRHDIPPFERARRPPLLFDETWGAENSSFPSAKKQKSSQFPDKELPEYPFSDFVQEKFDHAMPKFFPGEADNNTFNRNFHSGPLARKGVPDFPRNPVRPFVEGDESWRSFDGLDAGPSPSLPIDAARFEKVNSEAHQQPPLKEEWKWEGTIAKGGSPVCRARCFPVGKVLDFMLPEFLNCTARTGLDMLAKHYYQASNTWVVFFVPQTDADITFYNEFMHYLGEKQRAAVAKLGEKLTLFLVPPSDFSEQVLKVPGKVSISGVVLQFQQPSPNFTSMQHSTEVSESKIPAIGNRLTVDDSVREDSLLRKLNSPDLRPLSQGQSYLGSTSLFPPPRKFDEYSPYIAPSNPPERPPDFRGEIRQNQFPQQTHAIPSNRLNQNNASNSSLNAAEAFPLLNPRVPHGATSSNLNPETSSSINIPFSTTKLPQQPEVKHQPSSSLPLPLQPDQLAQLATLLAQQKQSGKEPISSLDKESKQSNMFQSPSSILPQVSTSAPPKSASGLPPNRPYDSPASASAASGFLPPQISQMQNLQQHLPNISALQTMVSSAQESSQQAPNSSREDSEADPQKRLQATLQLAAALLQQIQQQSKTGDQR